MLSSYAGLAGIQSRSFSNTKCIPQCHMHIRLTSLAEDHHLVSLPIQIDWPVVSENPPCTCRPCKVSELMLLSHHSRPERQSGPAHGVAREGFSWIHPGYYARNSCILPSRGRMTSNPASRHGGAFDGIHSYATYTTHQQNSFASFPVY